MPWNRRRNGNRLIVEWIPGNDGFGNPLPIGKGLRSALELSGDNNQIQPSGTPDSQTKTQPDEAIQTPQVVQPPSPKKEPEAKPAPAPSEEPPESTPWSIIVVLVVVAIGLLWLLLKRRS